MPDWREEAAAAVHAWIEREGRGHRGPERVTLGVARPEGDGWYTVDLRGKRENPDQLDGLQLEAVGRKHRVTAAVQEGEVLRVRVARHVSDRGLRLTASRKPVTMLLEKLRDSLRTLTDAGGCAHRLAQGRIDPLPSSPAERGPIGFTAGQQQAFQACLTPGVRLVWGPPGTGKTLVLAAAIDRLLERGHRVLLVSGTNVAVDNALLGVMGRRRRAPGRLVRVGPPQLQAVAEDESVSLPRLVASRAAALDRERGQVEDRLAELAAGNVRLNELDELRSAYDPAAYAVAVRMLEVDRRTADLRRRLLELRDTASAAVAARDDAERERIAAEAAWQAIAPARRHLDEAARLRRELDDLQVLANRAIAAHQQMALRHESMRAHLAAAESARGLAWLRNRTEARRLRRHTEDLDAPAARAEAAMKTAIRLVEDQQRLLGPRIAEHERDAAPLDHAQAAARLAGLEAVRRRADKMAREADVAARQVASAEAELRVAESLPRATEAQRQLIADAHAAGWPALAGEREELRSAQRRLRPEVQRWERRYDELIAEQERQERNAEREIINQARLVATTLARFRLHQDVAAGVYDTVLVDEVGASTLAEVLVPVAAAKRTAVLLGDFLQLGPVLKDEVKYSPDPQLGKWVKATCFDHCGIRTPADARDRNGCAVLDTQYRFGPDVMELANGALYAGTLRAGIARERSELEHEVVLIDTDGLGDLAVARRGPNGKSRWWPAGSLLAPILAQHHADRGERVGLIAPYRPQAEAIPEALHDAEGASARLMTEAGTAHGFQGREFDVVVFDLVEDGEWRGWIAGSRLDEEGARVLNVGITRCKTRLYLVGSASVIRSAGLQPRMALAPVRELLEAGRIHVVRAAELLQVPEAGTPMALDPVMDELSETLARHVRVVGIHDEHTYYRELHRHLNEAERSIWLWSPWTMKRTEELLPALRAARDRGCRVTVFALTELDKGMTSDLARRELARLREAVTQVVLMRQMHQKIVVVDDRTVMYGSLNTLSHQDRREIMVIHQGGHFARKLLEHEHADVFASPPSGACGDQAALWRSGAAAKEHAWSWQCAKRACRWTEQVRFGRERTERAG